MKRHATCIWVLSVMCVSCLAEERPAKPVGPCSGTPDAPQGLLQRRVDLVLERAALHDVVERLRAAGAPVSFVDARAEDVEEPLVSLPAGTADTLEHALAQVLRQTKSYRCAVLHGHLILYPPLAKYEQIVRGVEIVALARMRAAWKYTEWLNARAPGFENLASQPVRGYPAARLYVEPVTLQAEASVLDHFAQLLGPNPNVVFSVEKTCPDGTCRGARLWLSELRTDRGTTP